MAFLIRPCNVASEIELLTLLPKSTRPSTPHCAEPPTAFFQHPFTNIVFAELRKASVSFVMSVRLSAWNNVAPTARIFMKFDIWEFFENLKGKFKFH
jgi:hypothetical protein